MSGRSSWCFTDDHPGCRFVACTCACHAGAPERPDQPVVAAVAPVAPVAAVPARPVPAGVQAELAFADGIDGSTDDVATVALSLRGQAYEVDLSRGHREQLRAALAPFVEAARPVRE
ncbi:MAG: Lsr2 family protein [Quadrisphaera sp.]